MPLAVREEDTGWRGDMCPVFCLGQHSGFPIDAETDDTLTILVRDIEEVPGRIEREVARGAAIGWLVREERNPARTLLDTEDGDTVVSAIGNVNAICAVENWPVTPGGKVDVCCRWVSVPATASYAKTEIVRSASPFA